MARACTYIRPNSPVCCGPTQHEFIPGLGRSPSKCAGLHSRVWRTALSVYTSASTDREAVCGPTAPWSRAVVSPLTTSNQRRCERGRAPETLAELEPCGHQPASHSRQTGDCRTQSMEAASPSDTAVCPAEQTRPCCCTLYEDWEWMREVMFMQL